MTHARLLVGAVVMAALHTVAGCSSEPATRSSTASPTATRGDLVYTGKFFSVMAPASETGPVSVGSLELCATSPLIVTNITAADARGGLTITGWGHRPNPFASGGPMLGAETKSLAALGFSSSPLPMTSGCNASEGTNAEFAVEMARPASTGTDTPLTIGLRVTYTQTGESHTFDVPWTLGYCGTDKNPAPNVYCSAATGST